MMNSEVKHHCRIQRQGLGRYFGYSDMIGHRNRRPIAAVPPRGSRLNIFVVGDTVEPPTVLSVFPWPP